MLDLGPVVKRVPKGVLGEVLPEPNLNPAAGFSGSAALEPNLNPPELGVLSVSLESWVEPNLNPPE